MTTTFPRGNPAATAHRLDLPCEATGFTKPPFDVHLKFLPPATTGPWTLLAHAAAGKPDALALWLTPHPGIDEVVAVPGIASKVLRAKSASLPPAWADVASFVKIHHLDLAADGSASWFIEGTPERLLALLEHLKAEPRLASVEVRCRPVQDGLREATISRRQFEALATAVSLGYYQIPHHIDLRTLALRTGISLGSVSELLRRAEGTVLTHYVDSVLMRWPLLAGDDPLKLPEPIENLLHR